MSTIYGGSRNRKKPKRMSKRNVVKEEYENPLFEALATEYKRLRDRLSKRDSMLAKMEREYQILGFDDDVKETMDEALETVRKHHEKKDAEDIAKFEEILKDPSVLRGKLLGSSLGICDDDPLMDDEDDFVGYEDPDDELLPF